MSTSRSLAQCTYTTACGAPANPALPSTRSEIRRPAGAHHAAGWTAGWPGGRTEGPGRPPGRCPARTPTGALTLLGHLLCAQAPQRCLHFLPHPPLVRSQCRRCRPALAGHGPHARRGHPPRCGCVPLQLLPEVACRQVGQHGLTCGAAGVGAWWRWAAAAAAAAHPQFPAAAAFLQHQWGGSLTWSQPAQRVLERAAAVNKWPTTAGAGGSCETCTDVQQRASQLVAHCTVQGEPWSGWRAC